MIVGLILLKVGSLKVKLMNLVILLHLDLVDLQDLVAMIMVVHMAMLQLIMVQALHLIKDH